MTATRCTAIPGSRENLAGFPKPILHGLCTYGVAGRALVAELGGNDATKVTAVGARFTSPVFPGETLTTSIWRTEPGHAVFRTEAAEADGSNQRVVLEDGTVGVRRLTYQVCSAARTRISLTATRRSRVTM